MHGKVIPISERRNSIVVALVGQPNVGKSTIYNSLTGSNQRIGNWPGKTVEIAWSRVKIDSEQIILVDLPGTYALSGFTEEEEVAVRFIVEEKPDVVVVITDVSALARNLYLLLQVLELTSRVVLIVNMLDEAERWGIKINLNELSEIFGIPVIGTIAIRGIGVKDILRVAVSVARFPPRPKKINYGELEDYIVRLEKLVRGIATDYPPRFFALQLIENYETLSPTLPKEIRARVSEIFEEIRARYRRDPRLVLASTRYKIIDDILLKILVKKRLVDKITEKLDMIFLRRGLDIIMSFTILFGAFYIAFTLGEILADIFSGILDNYLAAPISTWLQSIVASEWIRGLIVDGILGGIISTITFLPLIFVFTFTLSFIENLGVLARISLALDRMFSKFDMSGKAFFPIVTGLACNVVAVTTTRVLPSSKEKLRIMIASQFVQCPPRQVVIAIILGLLFSPLLASIIFILYIILGFILVLLISRILRIFEGAARREAPIELPPYRLPSMRVLTKISWSRSKIFIRRAGTMIVMANIVFWFLLNIPPGASPQNSLLGIIGGAIATILTPIGLGWREAVSLLAGLVAKEITLGVIEPLYGSLSIFASSITLASAIAFVTIYAYYMPCIATMSVIKTESGSWKTVIKAIIISTTVALVLGYASYFITKIIT